MIFYTIMPKEWVFPFKEEEFAKQREIVYDGVPLTVELTDHLSFKVIRINSSNPAHFLDSRFIPGNIISLATFEGS